MKKLLKFFLAGAMSLSLAACGGNSSSDDAGETTSDIKIAMITDSGDITDQSFNQTTYETGKAFAEANGLDFNYYKPTADTDAARIEMVDKAVNDGYNVLLLPGYLFAEAVSYGSIEYPDVKFIAVDLSEFDLLGTQTNGKDSDNVADHYNLENTYTTVYQEEIPGFMAGYAAVKLGYTKLGFLGGAAVPAVVRYGYGFVQGCDAAASELGITVDVNYVYGGQFYGDPDITAKMETWYSKGTEVVFACGGGIFTSACEAAAKYDGKVIGVDVDQAPSIDAKYGEGMTVTSALKGLANTIKTLLQAVVDGKFDQYAGKIDNLGLVSADASVNYVGLADSTQYEEGKFTAADYEALVEKIYNKEITISNDISADPTTTNANMDNQGSIK